MRPPWKYCIISVAVIVTALRSPSVLSAKTTTESERVTEITRPTTEFSIAEPFERLPAGAATVFRKLDRNSFSYSSANMDFEHRLDFRVGSAVFEKLWVSAPASTKSSDGLGPLFNARSCHSCHIKNGRGRAHSGSRPANKSASLFLRLSIPAQTPLHHRMLKEHRLSIIPDPVYGAQLQEMSIQGHFAEGRMDVDYQEVPLHFSDGTVVHLRKPKYSVSNWKYGPPHPKLRMSPRVAPPMIGLGLLEAISEADILSFSDPQDQNQDGISGKVNQVWDIRKQSLALGRFGWKAGQPDIYRQSSAAAHGDIGLSVPVKNEAWGDCTEAQSACRDAPDGNTPQQGNLELSSKALNQMVYFAKNIGVPARRNINDPLVLSGKQLFYETGCVSCHRPKFVTMRLPRQPEQSFQLIWPYTDLLLHDMGEGLADHRPEGDADGFEWRTPPLWGIGLTRTVNGHTQFLHDGRARNLVEAVLWHGGEAEAAKQKVLTFDAHQREALLAFLNSL